MTIYSGLGGPTPDDHVYIGSAELAPEVDVARAEGALTPGMLVIAGTLPAEEVAPAGDGALNVVGVVLENDLKADDLGLLVAFADNDDGVPYAISAGRYGVILADGETVDYGDKLVAAAGGEVRKYAPQTDLVAGDPGGAVIGKYVGKAQVITSGATARIAAYLGGI